MPKTLTYTEVAALGRIVAEGVGVIIIPDTTYRRAVAAILVYQRGTDGMPYRVYLTDVNDKPAAYTLVAAAATATMAYGAMEPREGYGSMEWDRPGL